MTWSIKQLIRHMLKKNSYCRQWVFNVYFVETTNLQRLSSSQLFSKWMKYLVVRLVLVVALFLFLMVYLCAKIDRQTIISRVCRNIEVNTDRRIIVLADSRTESSRKECSMFKIFNTKIF